MFGLVVGVAVRPAAQGAPAQAPQQTQIAAAGDPNRWEPAISRFEAQDKVSPPPRNAIVFVGASSIVRWDLPKYFPELGAKAINRGFGGSLISDSVRYADRIVTPYKPRIVVLYAGDNDVEAGVSAVQIASQFTEFERKVHAALPQTRIVFISIKPSIRRWKWVDTIRAANAKVREYCAAHPNLAYVDIDPLMIGADGKPNPDLLVADGLHMTPAGYEIWTRTLRSLLKLPPSTF
jgi:lysophospholipase L1-like esterase